MVCARERGDADGTRPRSWTTWSVDVGANQTAGDTENAVVGSYGTFSVDEDGNKVLSDEVTHYGAPGREYEITLPTGEIIYFRNSDATGSIRSQQGQVVIKAPGAETPDQAADALSHAIEALKDFRVSLDVEATESSLENTYWNEMFGLLQHRNPKSGSWAKAQTKFRELAASQNVNPDDEANKDSRFGRAICGCHWFRQCSCRASLYGTTCPVASDGQQRQGKWLWRAAIALVSSGRSHHRRLTPSARLFC